MDFARFIEDYGPLLTAWLIRLLTVIVALVFALVVAGWAKRGVRGALERAKVDSTLTRFFANITRWTILVLAIVGCLGVFGIETTSFAALIGAAGLAIGLGFQGSLSHLAAGVMLLVFRPFRVGDWITVASQTGAVDGIDLFLTTLDTGDNKRIFIPNGQIFGNVIENITFHDTRRVDVVVGTHYEADLDKTRAVLEELLNAVPERLPEKDTQVQLAALADSSINWNLRVWVATADYWPVRERLLEAVKKRLDAEGISIPFPQLELHPGGGWRGVLGDKRGAA